MDNKEALQELLRHCRSRIDPTELGWPERTGRGRRAEGLSQAQVAQMLYMTARWYAELERGALDAPSPEMLDNVARVLRMSENERIALYLYALGYEPPVRRGREARGGVAPGWQKALDAITGYPAYIGDVAWNILAYNDLFLRLFPRAPGEEPRLPEQNLMRWMLLREEAREQHMLDWEARWVEPLVAQLRAAVAGNPHNRDLQELDRDVSSDPVVGPYYRRRSAVHIHSDGDHRRCRNFTFSPPRTGDYTVCAAEPYGTSNRLYIVVFDPDPLVD